MRNTLIGLFAVLAMSCTNGNTIAPPTATEQKQVLEVQKETLEQQIKRLEWDNKRDYIALGSTTLDWNMKKKGLFREEIKDGTVKGTIVSTAKYATFSDVPITIQYLSKTGSVVWQNTFVVYEFLPPGKVLHFNFKVPKHKDISKFNATIDYTGVKVKYN